ncbi:MAG: hypothetical protein QOD53_1644 [Thermoleophilaceae bacterium]|nr:hypothetical protein [Thermoleophilaceae bacterium]
MSSTAFREITSDRAEEFAARGHRRRHFFPHRLLYLPKCGPDAFLLADAMLGVRDPARHRELVLYADRSLAHEFPRELFFDDDVVWHRQQFGRPGQIATANVVLGRRTIHTTVHISDLVQRIGRRREHKTRMESLFGGWAQMLLNGVLAFGLENGVRTVMTPTAELAMANTDPARTVGPELYERVYDRAVQGLFPDARRAHGWWRIRVRPDRVVVPQRGSEPLPEGPVVCVGHDIERGLGHVATHPEFAAGANRSGPESLERMLAVEAEAGCRATYSVVGMLLDEVRGPIEAGGHALAFHSYDHSPEQRSPVPGGLRRRVLRTRAPGPREVPELYECRAVDYRLKGYRPPRSRIGPGLADANLLFHNFEWLASAPHTLGTRVPAMTNGIVKLPVAIDDFELWRGRVSYARWEDMVVAAVEGSGFGAVCLHDCYGPHWLPHYPRLLERLAGVGRLSTMDEVAAGVTLAHAD